MVKIELTMKKPVVKKGPGTLKIRQNLSNWTLALKFG